MNSNGNATNDNKELELRMNAVIQVMQTQRDAALNQVVQVSSELAVVQVKLQDANEEIAKMKKDCEDCKSEAKTPGPSITAEDIHIEP